MILDMPSVATLCAHGLGGLDGRGKRICRFCCGVLLVDEGGVTFGDCAVSCVFVS